MPPTTDAPTDPALEPVLGDIPAADPGLLAASWLPALTDEPMRMTLSTIDAHGYPRARTLLLSEFDGERFFFHTDARSRKVADLAADPRVALTILWPDLSRQLVVQGTAAPAPADECAEVYRRRSPYLQQLAWLNTAGYAQLPLAEREARWARFRAETPAPPQPPEWVGFGVRPHRMLFWAAHPEAAGRRVEYVRNEDGWRVSYLPG
ncbi:pyridoxine/pyridoxamine 5'-phosphate oxidase [Microbacterium lushaniae]|uniref:Pyridoxamine 5-phosphate oxidase n=1 Tax=Microbacterium lushaniae TaxID=2614639 RepID=A0A5J6L1H5_9MICO|nr:pyridoxamine 5'-phosphate oxidase family protein [Microbacterium lushaniae]QEW02363.1 pyridoxamine 5-phosphate oxidase [Microbacterium lushaniae]